MEFGPVVGLFVFLPLMVIASALSLPFVPIAAYWNRRKRRLLIQAMTRQSRVLPWPDFVRCLEEKRGTLIVEGDPRKGPQLWWTPEDVRGVSPSRCSESLSSLFDQSYAPFMQWSFERYTSSLSGSALLVLGGEGQRRGFAIGSEEDELGRGIFERCRRS